MVTFKFKGKAKFDKPFMAAFSSRGVVVYSLPSDFEKEKSKLANNPAIRSLWHKLQDHKK